MTPNVEGIKQCAIRTFGFEHPVTIEVFKRLEEGYPYAALNCLQAALDRLFEGED